MELASPNLRAEVDKILDTLNIEEHKEASPPIPNEPVSLHPLDQIALDELQVISFEGEE